MTLAIFFFVCVCVCRGGGGNFGGVITETHIVRPVPLHKVFLSDLFL